MSWSDTPDSYQIFLNYRREEASAVAGRLYDRLQDRFGHKVFMDIPSIGIGQDFLNAIEEAVASCQIMLVLIGDSWHAVSDNQGNRRLDDPDDMIRLELEAALRYHVPILPVLIDDASMPAPETLPGSLMPLARHGGIRLHRDRFRSDVELLIGVVEKSISSTERVRPSPSEGKIQLAPPPVRDLIFVSYSHADEYWLGRLQIHLKPLARQGRVELWDDTQIQVGDEWRSEIRKALEACSVAILLISADFMASDFIDKDELPPLLEAARERGVRILPVIVSSSYFENSDLGRFQAVNTPSKPLDMVTKGEQEAVFAKLHKAVRVTLLS